MQQIITIPTQIMISAVLRLLLLTFLLTSCGRSYQNHEFVASSFNNEEMAVLIFKVRGETDLFKSEPKVTFDLVKIDETTGINTEKSIYYRVKGGFFGRFNPWDSTRECLMVKPGFYVIDNITWQVGNVTYTSDNRGFARSCPVGYGAFEVKAGTVNYLGDLELTCSQKRSLLINRKNRFHEAREELEKKQPDLAPLLQETDFLPAGYCHQNLKTPNPV